MILKNHYLLGVNIQMFNCRKIAFLLGHKQLNLWKFLNIYFHYIFVYPFKEVMMNCNVVYFLYIIKVFKQMMNNF